ncbi:hypothetical protein E2C01_008696 [Portunus trituberculatus]|uniref:Uncharacterized protein n=1 Tax=Portunus trituberculatus TaxID=210409 RepID=A0A5B7D1G5_PORTR|nr:hypothetical protein [Portunus trituberculatus]
MNKEQHGSHQNPHIDPALHHPDPDLGQNIPTHENQLKTPLPPHLNPPLFFHQFKYQNCERRAGGAGEEQHGGQATKRTKCLVSDMQIRAG